MSEPSINDGQSDTESTEELIEPKLKYARLSNDLHNILLNDAAKCIAVHPKFICLGTDWGVIHLLDHQGNSIKEKEFRVHTVAVNQISIDSRGDFIATCSDDGKVFIHGLYTHENNHNMNVGRLVKTIALEPSYYKSGSGRRFITGDDKLTLYEKTFLGRLRPTVLCESEGLVRSLCWGENFIAWSSDIGVRVYDINARCSLGLIKWEEHSGISIDKFKCNLRWADSRTLLIGWVDTVRVCVIRKRSSIEFGNRELPEYLVDPVSTFQTEFYISGIAPLDHQLVLLGFPKELDENQKSLRPQLYIVEYKDNDYIEICTDTLSLRGYQQYNVNDYHLDVLIDENRFFIVAPKDIVIASPYDLDDRIQWLMEHKKFEEALDALEQADKTERKNVNEKRNKIEQKRYTKESVGETYLDHLIMKKCFDEAGKLCLKICGQNKKLWEEQIFKFTADHQLRSVSKYIPKTPDCKLAPQIYEMVLYEYLILDAQGFLSLVKEWNPELYCVRTLTDAILGHLSLTDDDRLTYFEALAILYAYDKRYDKCLAIYLKMQHKDVFTLIRKHNLYSVIHDMIVQLMDLDYEQTVAMLLEKDRIPSEVVVEKLERHELHLYRYLDAYSKKDTTGKYHGKLVKLYAIHERDKLLPFLNRSDHYPIQEALDICRKAKYYPEMVHLLDRIGDTKEALDLIMNKLKDMQKAITFCQEHNDKDLWKDLIDYSIDKPECVTFLLRNIGNYIDPTILVNKIKEGDRIPEIKSSLVKMLCDYSLQVAIKEGCKKILSSDYFELHNKLVRRQQKGIFLSDEMVCGACYRKIIAQDASRTNNILAYYCKHTFHKQCLPDTQENTNCGICHPTNKK